MRYIRLTELIPPLLDMVDERKIAFNPAYELSFLTKDEQQLCCSTRWTANRPQPSLSQAQRLKQFSQRGELDAAVMRAIMSEEKKEVERVTLKGETLRKYFPSSVHAEAHGGDYYPSAGAVAETAEAAARG